MNRRPLLTILLLLSAFVWGIACAGGEHAADRDWPDVYDVDQSPATASAKPTPTPYSERCGYERWQVKTLSDKDISTVNFTPVPTTVDALRALSTPKSLPQNHRVAPTELQTFTLTATLARMKQEPDGDIHVVVADPSNATHTMIVEFPDAAKCSKATPALVQQMEAARQALIARFGPPPTGLSYKRLSGTATLTGVGFFDILHTRDVPAGVAPNRVELHPILTVSFGS